MGLRVIFFCFFIFCIYLSEVSFARDSEHVTPEGSTSKQIQTVSLRATVEEAQTGLKLYRYPELDPRCLHSSLLDTEDEASVDLFNRTCALEMEIIRRTNEHRNRMGRKTLKTSVELSYVARQNLKKGYRGHSYFPNAHLDMLKNFFPQLYKDPSNKPQLFAENAWPPANHGEKLHDIAYRMTDSQARGSDGLPMGWNFHGGHARNVLNASATHIGVAVEISPNGSVSSYAVFGTIPEK